MPEMVVPVSLLFVLFMPVLLVTESEVPAIHLPSCQTP